MGCGENGDEEMEELVGMDGEGVGGTGACTGAIRSMRSLSNVRATGVPATSSGV